MVKLRRTLTENRIGQTEGFLEERQRPLVIAVLGEGKGLVKRSLGFKLGGQPLESGG